MRSRNQFKTKKPRPSNSSAFCSGEQTRCSPKVRRRERNREDGVWASTSITWRLVSTGERSRQQMSAALTEILDPLFGACPSDSRKSRASRQPVIWERQSKTNTTHQGWEETPFPSCLTSTADLDQRSVVTRAPTNKSLSKCARKHKYVLTDDKLLAPLKNI